MIKAAKEHNLISLFRTYKVQPIKNIKDFEHNSRTHSEEQIQEVVNSINEFGYTNPILVDENNVIIAGHCRVAGAKRCGFDEIPTIIIDGLTDVQKSALVIADNKMALNAGWNYDKLINQISFLKNNDFNMDLTGFTADEIATFMPDEIPPFDGDEDEIIEPPTDPITKIGDIWLLGNHRLMCGDSTMIDQLQKLINGEKIEIVFTDPPYNLGYEYNSYKDDKKPEEYFNFCTEWFNCLNAFTDRIIITPGMQNIGLWYKIMNPTGIAIWLKRNAMSSCKISNLNIWEPILFYGGFKRTRPNDVFEINLRHQVDVGDSHTCPKQVELIEEIIKHYSCKENVLDVFGGSGTTLIACEKLNKKSFLMELDPKYCDVIVARWENLTGKKAKLESSDGTRKTA